ncbi:MULTISPECIES: hypothetical protein [Bradyrhizobium]|uniref:Uncharacterized protein n=1 Tax=Bradyrhizobium quebecense TaxID=2748629 RepID=A0ACD3V293_9BRAD|nr:MULTISPECIES: hypothetical protein [Bradyrhizobium]UFX44316.1 hypothetical protein HAP47_0035540 [Bradyrhizobium sp. 41S5]UGA44284.1 hypothetical protein HU230_0039860 [Bradyrhizobium quebecense]UGY00516.1 hypothetical protein J4P68_0025045 [Bradyrhizobium quebecense]
MGTELRERWCLAKPFAMPAPLRNVFDTLDDELNIEDCSGGSAFAWRSAFDNRGVDCLKAVWKGGHLTALLPMFLLISLGGILLVCGYALGV